MASVVEVVVARSRVEDAAGFQAGQDVWAQWTSGEVPVPEPWQRDQRGRSLQRREGRARRPCVQTGVAERRARKRAGVGDDEPFEGRIVNNLLHPLDLMH
jgi:hypothetical protein